MAIPCKNQTYFGFYDSHRRAIESDRERKRRERMLARDEMRRVRSGSRKHLLQLAELPESHLTAGELRMLDDYVYRKATIEIRERWTAEREAEGRGVDIRKAAAMFMHDGRLFACDAFRSVAGIEDEFGYGDE